MSYQAGIDRDQAVLFPMTIEELIPQEHLVRIIDLFIQNTDLKKLGFSDTFFSQGNEHFRLPRVHKNGFKSCFL